MPTPTERATLRGGTIAPERPEHPGLETQVGPGVQDSPEVRTGPEVEARPETQAGPAAPATDAPRAGHAPLPAPAVAEAAPRKKRRRLWLLLPILLVIGGVAGLFGYRYWYESTYFVMTENASVTGDLVQVGSLNAGRLLYTRVEVGDTVKQGQEIAVVGMPQQVGAVPMGGAPVMQETGGIDAQVPVRAPLNGIVAARMGSAGGTVSAGQPIYAIVDPTQVWVKANIEEDKIARVQVGQPVEVHVDALGQSFPGKVASITPASAATFSLLPSGNTSGNFTKVTQLVPIKIVVDSGGAVLPLGTSVEIKILVRQPGGGLPWQP